MPRSVTFLLLSLACAYLAWQAGGARAVLWGLTAWSFLGVALAYALRRPGLLAKRADGRTSVAVIVLLPVYFVLTWGIWFLARLFPRYPHSHEIIPGLWLGAWPPHQKFLPPATRLVIDLTAEFPRRVAVERYLCLPTLDMEAPTRDQLAQAIQAIQETEGTVYVHCAAGHGRSATIVAAALLARGVVTTPEEAEALLQKIRAGVKLTPPQRQLLASATIAP